MAPKCKACKQPYERARPMQVACSILCAIEVAEAKKQKAAKAVQRENAKALRERREALKTLSQLLKEAQIAFNAYIRERDRDLPCISCGVFGPRKWDAGHYLSVGAHRELRFDEINVAKQCVPCNQHKSGNQAMFRVGLLMRYGEAEVLRLEGPNPMPLYTKDDARRIRAEYKAKLKALSNPPA